VKWATESSKKETMHESPDGHTIADGSDRYRCLVSRGT